MKWLEDAEEAVKKVPFFVRKKVKARVEKEAMEAGKKVVSLPDVKLTQARYLSGMETEVKGYRVENCFGPGGCPNRANDAEGLSRKIEEILKSEDILGFLKERVKGPLRFHHEFRVSLADCPNACSQPQIKDIGIIGACLPATTEQDCDLCEQCVDVCKEDAIALDMEIERPVIDMRTCLACGKCLEVCPEETLAEARKGFRVQLGGKLGRHPQLARELPGIYSEDRVLEIVKDCVRLFKIKSVRGERFSSVFSNADFESLAEKFG